MTGMRRAALTRDSFQTIKCVVAILHLFLIKRLDLFLRLVKPHIPLEAYCVGFFPMRSKGCGREGKESQEYNRDNKNES
jgi:hypothetical protein